ncbi:MAG: hypothetical protein CVU89_11075 [Firmicutes bacterium HGW-Firmicutes-14]|nr:MAG: hypothetical protein CVU89_11075 [Firmicutes bacterium HGW-Firmicutes-14]
MRYIHTIKPLGNRRLLAGSCMLILLPLFFLCFTQTARAGKDPNILFNGCQVLFQGEKPYIDQNNCTQVPADFAADYLGAVISQDTSQKTISITKGDTGIILWTEEKKALVNGREVSPDSGAVNRNGTVMVPLRLVCETLGSGVEWVAETKTIRVTLDNGYILPESTCLSIIAPPPGNPDKIGLSILLFLDRDLDKQYDDIHFIMTGIFDTIQADEIVKHIGQKKTPKDNLPYRKWVRDDRAVTAGSEPGDSSISIIIWETGG